MSHTFLKPNLWAYTGLAFPLEMFIIITVWTRGITRADLLPGHLLAIKFSDGITWAMCAVSGSGIQSNHIPVESIFMCPCHFIAGQCIIRISWWDCKEDVRCYEWDEDQLKVVLRGVDLAAISKAYKGCTLVECDSAFKSGTYAGVFVPCKVKLANGKETKLNVAMRNNNLWNIWTLDGGFW